MAAISSQGNLVMAAENAADTSHDTEDEAEDPAQLVHIHIVARPVLEEGEVLL